MKGRHRAVNGQRRFARVVPFVFFGSLLGGIALVAFTSGPAIAAPMTFTVVSTADATHGNCGGSCTLRDAVNAASAAANATTPVTINIPAGTYTLTLGELDLAATNGSITLNGTSGNRSTVVINQTSKTGGSSIVNNTVFLVAFNLSTSASVTGQSTTFQNLTIEGGVDTRTGGGGGGGGFGGGAIQDDGGTGNSLTITNCVFSGNKSLADGAGGGAIFQGAGALTVSNSTFTGNTSASGFGGGIGYSDTGLAAGDISITNSTFTNNSVTAPAGSSDGGGGAFLGGATITQHATVSGSTFTGNSAGATGGGLYIAAELSTSVTTSQFVNNTAGTVQQGQGGAVYMSSTNPTPSSGSGSITLSTFTGNTASNGGQGGAVFNAIGPTAVAHNRIVGNTATTGSGIAEGVSSGSVNASDNWWGVNTGPGAGVLGAASVSPPATAPTASSWLQLRNIASPGTVLPGGASTFTADLLGRNTGGPLAAGSLNGLATFPTPTGIFSTAVDVTVGTASGQFINGVGTAGVTAGTTLGSPAGHLNVTADNQTVTGNLNIKANSSTSVATNPSTSVFGQPVTFTATLSSASGSTTPPAPAGGTVQFFVDGVSHGAAAPVSSGSANAAFGDLAVGNHTVTATYSGDADFNGSTTTTGATQIVNKANTSVAVGSSLNPAFVTQSITFSATITAVAPGAGIPGGTGSLQFMDGSNALGVAQTPNASGVATISINSLTVGTHTITAVYAGNANFNGSTGTLVPDQVVKLAPTSVNVFPSFDPSVFGQPVTFTAQVNAALAGTPAGFVQFGINGANFGATETLVSGQAVTPVISNLAVGSTNVTATYTPTDGLHAGSSGLFTQTVNQANTTTTIGSSANPAFAGVPLTFTATVTAAAPGAGTPTGNVQFVIDGANSGSPQALSGGVATLGGVSPAVGSHSVVADYLGDSNFTTSTSTTLTQVVNGFSTTTTLSSSKNPSVSGEPVTFTATVSAGPNGTPTGNVQFGVNGANIGSPIALSGGVAMLPSVTTLPVGTSTVTATYAASGNFNGSSGTLAGGQVVTKASSAVAVGSSVNPSALGQPVTFAATVTAVAPGTGTPAGQVQFFVDGSAFGSPATLSGSVASSGSDSSLAVGSHAVTATYTGNGNFNGSTSPALTQVVSRVAPTIVIGSSVNPSVFGQPVQFSVTITGSAGTPTGSVQFGVNGADLGTPVTLTAGKASSIADTSLPVGNSTITATYTGDTTYLPGSQSLTQTVNKADTMTIISSSANPGIANSSLSFTATVTAVSPGAGIPTGQVIFQVDNGVFPVTLNANGVAVQSGIGLPEGTFDVVAAYQGDPDFNTSNGSLTEVVNGFPTTTTLNSSANPSVSGQPVTFTATVGPDGEGVPAGNVQFGVDGANVGSPVALSGGVAQLPSISTLSVGTHTVTATYVPSDSHAGSSGTLAGGQVVTKASSSATVGSSLNPSALGQPVNFTATVTAVAPGSGTPTGQVQFFIDGSAFGSPATLTGGVGSSGSTSSLTPGSHSVTATYTGDGSFSGSTSPILTQVVGRIDATFGLTSTVASPVFGQPVQFTATLTGAVGTPTGSIQFGVDGVNLGSPVALSGGTATSVADTALPVGTSTVTATYTGDTTYLPGSQSITQSVNQANTTTTIGSSANPATAGTAIDFAATVTAVAPGAGTPTGQVQFFADGSTLGSPAGLNAAGVASLSGITSLSIGSHSVTATYLGDANFITSTAASLTQQVTGIGTTTTVASSANPSVFSQPVSFTATVSAGGNGTPTGSVQFGIDGDNIGDPVSLSGGIAQSPPVSTLAVGTHTVTATYSGAPTFVPSSGTLAGGQVVIQDGTTTTLTASANPSIPGQSVTFTATVSPVAPGAGTPTGQVLFQFNGGPLGLVNLVNGVAVSPPTANLSPGSYDVTATFQGSSGYTSSSGTLTQVVSQLSTTTTLSSSDHGSGPVGSPVTFTATVSAGVGQPAPSGTVAFFSNGAPITGCGTQALNGAAPDTATCSTIHQLPVGASTVTATYSGSPTALPSTSPPFTETTSATTTITGSHRGALTVKAGQTLFIGPGASITGSITVQAGGSLDVEGATVKGSITASGAVQIRMCGSSLSGGATITHTSGLVVIGDDEGSPSCAGNTISGAVSITNGTGGVEFDFNTVSGSVTITGNTGTVPPPDTGTVVAVGNTIGSGSTIQ